MELTKNCQKPSYSLVGAKFGLWEVISWEGKNWDHRNFWLCRCECGTEKIVGDRILRNGKSKSCGCSTKKFQSKHNLINTSEYLTWGSMKNRCHNPKKDCFL